MRIFYNWLKIFSMRVIEIDTFTGNENEMILCLHENWTAAYEQLKRNHRGRNGTCQRHNLKK